MHVGRTEEEVLIGLADFFIKKANESVTEHGTFNVSLSGGGSPQRLYEILALPPYNKLVAWDKVYFFFGDERYVPFDDPASNGLMVKKALFDPLKISSAQIFYIDTSLKPEEAAAEYEKTILTHFNGKPLTFGLALLGLGDNSHTASLFPYTPVINETAVGVRAVYLKDQGIYRITMTAPLINQAEQVAFLVYGENKAAAVFNVLKGQPDVQKYPAQLIHPVKGNLHWYMDKKAARLLQ